MKRLLSLVFLAVSVTGCGADSGDDAAGGLAFPAVEADAEATPTAVNCAGCDWSTVAYPEELVAEIGYGDPDPTAGNPDQQARDLGRTCQPCLPEPILEGHLTIENAVELEELVDYRSVTGSVTIESQGLAVIDLPNLQVVLGSLEIHVEEGLHELRAPELVYVGGYFSLSGLDLTVIELPLLEVVGLRDGVNFGIGAVGVETLRLPSLRVVSNVLGGLSNIAHCPNLRRIELPALEHTRQLSLYRNPRLESFDFSSLTLVSKIVEIQENEVLSNCTISAFRQQLREQGYEGPFVATDNGGDTCY